MLFSSYQCSAREQKSFQPTEPKISFDFFSPLLSFFLLSCSSYWLPLHPLRFFCFLQELFLREKNSNSKSWLPRFWLDKRPLKFNPFFFPSNPLSSNPSPIYITLSYTAWQGKNATLGRTESCRTPRVLSGSRRRKRNDWTKIWMVRKFRVRDFQIAHRNLESAGGGQETKRRK